MGCGDTFAVTGNLAAYSNQYSNPLCLKSCKVCLNEAVRASHLATLGPYPCCKGQLSNAWTIREIINLTQLEPRLGSLPGLQRLCACYGYSFSDTGVTAVWDIRDRVTGRAGGRECSAGRNPKNTPDPASSVWRGASLHRGLQLSVLLSYCLVPALVRGEQRARFSLKTVQK